MDFRHKLFQGVILKRRNAFGFSPPLSLSLSAVNTPERTRILQ
jgi:hypothetical protein